MARGIIVVKPNSTGGKLIVTDGSPSSGSGVAQKPVDSGTIITFTDVIKESLGDDVSFIYDDQGVVSNITFVSAGRVVTGLIKDLTVPAGQSVLVTAANIDGKISVDGGALVMVDATTVEGKIECKVDGSYVLINGCTIDGKISVKGLSTACICDSTVIGAISCDGNTFSTVTGCTIDGKLDVTSAKTCKCSGNKVIGSTNTPGCTA
jgi:hypothetical protein